MKKCTYCESDVSETAKKCKQCGEWILDAVPKSNTSIAIDKGTSGEVEDNNFDPKAEAATHTPPTPAPPQKNAEFREVNITSSIAPSTPDGTRGKKPSSKFLWITFVLYIIYPVGLLCNAIGILTGPRRGAFLFMLFAMFIAPVSMILYILSNNIKTGNREADEFFSQARSNAFVASILQSFAPTGGGAVSAKKTEPIVQPQIHGDIIATASVIVAHRSIDPRSNTIAEVTFRENGLNFRARVFSYHEQSFNLTIYYNQETNIFTLSSNSGGPARSIPRIDFLKPGHRNVFRAVEKFRTWLTADYYNELMTATSSREVTQSVMDTVLGDFNANFSRPNGIVSALILHPIGEIKEYTAAIKGLQVFDFIDSIKSQFTADEIRNAMRQTTVGDDVEFSYESKSQDYIDRQIRDKAEATVRVRNAESYRVEYYERGGRSDNYRSKGTIASSSTTYIARGKIIILD